MQRAINYRELKRLYEGMGPREACTHLSEALRADHLKPEDFSILDLFESFVPHGRELVRAFNPGKSGSIGLLEASQAVDTSAFTNITGQIIYSKVIDAFNDPAFLHPRLVQSVPTQFNGEKIPGIGRLGDEAEEVAEAHPYPVVGMSEEWVETPETTKRGFIVPVTKEAIFFDRTGLVLQRAAEVAYWLGVNKEKRVLDVVLGITNNYKRNGTSYNTYNTGTPFSNTKASNSLVDWTSIEAAELLFDSMIDPNTEEPISVIPNTIIVPSALRHTARRIVNATEITHGDGSSDSPQVTSTNPIADQYQVLSGPMVKQRTSSDSTWFVGDPRRAFAYMENWPITVVQAPNNSEAEFSQDVVIRFKVSERGAAAVLDPRYMVKCTAE